MILNKQLVDDLMLLVEAREWNAIRTWFGMWENEDELVDKVLLWGTTFLPHYLRDNTPPFHRELLKENFSPKNEYTAAPRGFSKTTLNQLSICFQMANKLERFIVIVEKSFDEASEVIRGVVSEFRDNPLIKQVYGDLVKLNDAGDFDERNKDAQGDVLINGVRLRAKGFNTPIRGLKSNEWRPTKIYVDDVESDEHINSEEQRKKYRENYTQGIVPSIDIDGSIKVRGTILHNDSLLKNLIDQHGGKIWKAYDKANPAQTLLWPERWTLERLEQKRQEMEMQGLGSSKFYQEYLNEPLDDEFRPFKWEWLQKEFTDTMLEGKAKGRYATIDMAESSKDGADYTALVIVDWDSDNNWFIQRAKRYHINITGVVDLIFNVWQNDKPVKIGVEKKAFEDQIKPLLKLKSEETGIYPIVVQLEDGGRRKEDRIRGHLIGRFEAGKVYFKQGSTDNQKELKGELYDFPNAKNDDLCLVGDTRIATPFGNKLLKDIKKGDKVITPFGIRKVLVSKKTGEKEVIENIGLKGTKNHLVYTQKGFTTMDTLSYNSKVNKLTLLNIWRWKYQRLLCLMEQNIDEWAGKEGIILVSQQPIKDESILRDYIERFGNFITKRKFRQVMLFTIKTVILSITTLAIWNVYLVSTISQNTVRKIIMKIKSSFTQSWIRQEKKPLCGIEAKQAENGTENNQNNNGKIRNFLTWFVKSVRNIFNLHSQTHGFVDRLAKCEVGEGETQINGMQSLKGVESVYNLLVEKDNVYYANGLLVGNCDSLAYVAEIGNRPYSQHKDQMSSIDREFMRYKAGKMGRLVDKF